MATRPWLAHMRGGTGKKAAARKSREEQLMESVIGGRGDAQEGEPKRCWLSLVLWALAQEKPGKFAQLAVPAVYAEEIVGIVESSGMVTRLGASLTEEFRTLTLWEPSAVRPCVA